MFLQKADYIIYFYLTLYVDTILTRVQVITIEQFIWTVIHPRLQRIILHGMLLILQLVSMLQETGYLNVIIDQIQLRKH